MLPRWGCGIYLGIKRVSGELIIMNQEGVKIVRSARRIPVEDRWDAKALDWVKFVPWNLCEKDNTADGDIPDSGQSGPARAFTKEELENVKARPTRSRPSLQIKQEHCDEFGYTHRCPGCSARLRGLARQAHSDSCKARYSQLLETKSFLGNEDAHEDGVKRRSDEGE